MNGAQVVNDLVARFLDTPDAQAQDALLSHKALHDEVMDLVLAGEISGETAAKIDDLAWHNRHDVHATDLIRRMMRVMLAGRKP